MFREDFPSISLSSADDSNGIPGVDEQDMRRAFREIDHDNDGQISARDLRAFLESAGERPSDAEINEMIRLADTGKDGLVHLSEFFELFRPFRAEGHSNEVFERTVEIMSSMQADVRDIKIPGELQINQFIASLPGSVHSQPSISRDYLRDIIFRWRADRSDNLDYSGFIELLRAPESDSSERAFKIFSRNATIITVKQLIVIIGTFVAAPCEERVDFAFRIIDETNSGLLSESDVSLMLMSHFVGVKSDCKGRLERIMKGSDGNGLISRKELTKLSRYDPGLFFPLSRIDFVSN